MSVGEHLDHLSDVLVSFVFSDFFAVLHQIFLGNMSFLITIEKAVQFLELVKWVGL